MNTRYTQLTLMLAGFALTAGCAEERPPRSVSEFLENPIMLEAAMVRCSQDRDKTRYDAECMNARQAVQQIEAREEAERRAEFEARSDAKRRALRKTQEAASEARRRAAEAERLRKEAEYLAQFGVAMPPQEPLAEEEPETGNTPIAVIPENEDVVTSSGGSQVAPAVDGGNAPGSDPVAEEPQADGDLTSIRDELQRRSDDASN